MTLTPKPAVALEQIPGRPECRAVCTCGWEVLSVSASTAAQDAELHSLRCPRFRAWAHDAVNGVGDALGYYVPAQLVDLLHILVNEPAAAQHVMPWLVGLEDRENA